MIDAGVINLITQLNVYYHGYHYVSPETGWHIFGRIIATTAKGLVS